MMCSARLDLTTYSFAAAQRTMEKLEYRACWAKPVSPLALKLRHGSRASGVRARLTACLATRMRMNLARLLGEVDFPAANGEKWRALAEKGLGRRHVRRRARPRAPTTASASSRSTSAIPRCFAAAAPGAGCLPWLVVQRDRRSRSGAGQPPGAGGCGAGRDRACAGVRRRAQRFRLRPAGNAGNARRSARRRSAQPHRICASTSIRPAAPWRTGWSPT